MCVCNEPIQNVLQDPVVTYMDLLLVFYLFNSQLLVQQYEKELDALRQELAMHDLLVSCMDYCMFIMCVCDGYRPIVPVSIMSH